uniref:hypothetical protein n=1 Tax=Orrella sp. TaxID=1921583 RepID=UPI00405580DB
MKSVKTKGVVMKFPQYVPDVIRKKIGAMLDGDDWEPMGWHDALESAEERLTKIEADLRRKNSTRECMDSLRKQRKEAEEHRDTLKKYVSCLQRLATDPRMKAVYERLSEEFTDDERWKGFIHAAWAAEVDFSKYRDQLKRTAELNNEIANTAQKLADLLRKTSETGFSNWPAEYFGIPELLRKTDNHKSQDHNLHMWRSMRKHILGDRPIPDVLDSGSHQEDSKRSVSLPIVVRFVSPENAKIDPEQERLNTLQYAWGTAPDLSALLDTVVATARRFAPHENGVIGAGLNSRQKSRAENKAYLRAYGHLLTEVYGISLTSNVMKAMAQVATVVLDDPDFVVSYGDVTSALE